MGWKRGPKTITFSQGQRRGAVSTAQPEAAAGRKPGLGVGWEVITRDGVNDGRGWGEEVITGDGVNAGRGWVRR